MLGELLRGLATRRAPSWLNFWENMLGAGFACVYARSFRRDPPALVHAAWGGAPATAAWMLWRIDGHRFSAAAHAYDLFEHGGDWWLREKLEPAAFIHTSTEMGRTALLARGLAADRIFCIRRGLDRLPALQPLRASRSPLQLVAVARLVAKKGLDQQLRIYAALRGAGVPFAARICGDGPLRAELERLAGRLGVAADVTFTGHLPQHEIWSQLAWADVLLHTGVIAPSGDRDGLPNVIPEAMAIGTLVVTSPTAGTTEAVAARPPTFVARHVDDPGGLGRRASSGFSQPTTFSPRRLRGAARAWRRISTRTGTPGGCSSFLTRPSLRRGRPRRRRRRSAPTRKSAGHRSSSTRPRPVPPATARASCGYARLRDELAWPRRR